MPQRSGQQIAAWSPAATPRRVCPSMMRAVRPTTETSARSAATRPAPAGGARTSDGAVHRRDYRLRALDHVVHEVAGLAQHAHAVGLVAHDLVDQLEGA